MLFVLLEGSNIHLVPLCLTCNKTRACGPIKWFSVSAQRCLAHAYGGAQVLVGDKANIYPLACESFEDIVLHWFHYSLTRANYQCLIDGALYWTLYSHLYSQVCRSTSSIGYIELSSVIATCKQICTFHFIYVLTSSQVKILVQLQQRCSSAIEVRIWVRLSRINHYHLFFYTQGHRLVIGQLEINIILFQHFQEDTTKLILLFCASSQRPLFVHYNCTNWAVQRQFKSHMCLSSATVFYNKFQLVVVSLHLCQVEVIPLLTNRNGHTRPIEVNCFGTSVFLDILGLIHLS